MPDTTVLYFQGTQLQGGGNGTAFGDGLRCVGGTTLRLGYETNVGGASQYPELGDASLSVKGQITAPGLVGYQVWYRNAAMFCTAATFNVTNAVKAIWVP